MCLMFHTRGGRGVLCGVGSVGGWEGWTNA